MVQFWSFLLRPADFYPCPALWPKSSAPCIPVFDPSQKVKVEMNQMERCWWGWKQLWYTAGQRWGWLQPTLGSKSCKWWKRSIELNALSCETDISSLFLKSRCLHEEDLGRLVRTVEKFFVAAICWDTWDRCTIVRSGMYNSKMLRHIIQIFRCASILFRLLMFYLLQ